MTRNIQVPRWVEEAELSGKQAKGPEAALCMVLEPGGSCKGSRDQTCSVFGPL